MRQPIFTMSILMLLLAQPSQAQSLAAAFIEAAPAANPDVIKLAMEAESCAVSRGLKAPSRLAVIDYPLPSTDVRLWVFDLDRQILLQAEYVAHGKNSGGNFANEFSNIDGSFQTSLGLFTTAEEYTGLNGQSLRMDGLEPGINDRARPCDRHPWRRLCGSSCSPGSRPPGAQLGVSCCAPSRGRPVDQQSQGRADALCLLPFLKT